MDDGVDFYQACLDNDVETMYRIAKESDLALVDIFSTFIINEHYQVNTLENVAKIILENRPESVNSTYEIFFSRSVVTHHSILDPLILHDSEKRSLYALWELILPLLSSSHFENQDYYGMTPLFRLCAMSHIKNEAWILQRAKLLVKYGASVNPPCAQNQLLLGSVLLTPREELADYLIEQGSSTQGLRHPIIEKRNNCYGAKRALGVVLLRKKIVAKDIIQYLLMPMVWSTRLNPKWENIQPIKKVKV